MRNADQAQPIAGDFLNKMIDSSPTETEFSRASGRRFWTSLEVAAIHNLPVLELILKAADVHRRHHPLGEVQVCVLQSIKTGGCPEDCAYCPQSARFETPVDPEPLLQVDRVLAAAEQARREGATRFCMGAAWREVRDDERFERVLDMVRGVKQLGLEACCTLGMLTENQARRLKEAGLDAYNHNIDTSPEYYDKIITTRKFQDRLETLSRVREAGIGVCCGGIVGMGESAMDRVEMLRTLANLPEPPESVPINALVPVEGTPLADRPKSTIWDLVRAIATARILMPNSRVRLSAGRVGMSEAEQALCFLAGADSIFAGDKLLTTPNPGRNADEMLFEHLGLRPMPARV